MLTSSESLSPTSSTQGTTYKIFLRQTECFEKWFQYSVETHAEI